MNPNAMQTRISIKKMKSTKREDVLIMLKSEVRNWKLVFCSG
jgi:hypothetical protein